MRHQQDDGAGILARQAEPRGQGLDEGDALGDVPVALALADVVEQHAQHQQIGARQLVEHLGDALGLGGLARGERFQVLHGEQRVLVGGEG
jgi:hypothetical protein